MGVDQSGTAGETGGSARPTVTMTDVAARAGVSRALVSIVFRGVPGASLENRERVMRAAAELDYWPDHRARLLGRGRSRTIGVVFGLHREFHGSLVEHLYAAASGTSWDLALGASAPSRNERAAIRALLEQRCEAVVLLGPTMRASDLAQLAARLPVVVVARALRRQGPVDVVRTDDDAGGRIAVEHLAALGHRSLVHVDGGRAPGAAERRRGFRQAVADLGLEGRVLDGGTGDADGARSADDVVAGHTAGGATAITAFNDIAAAGLLAGFRTHGLHVPGDLSLVGYDDTQVAGLTGVALTTVAQDAAALARRSLELAVRRVEDSGRPCEEVVIEPSLVVRGTTGPPR
jgi:DNA-binding LacI/PurR family transcriptional regulator